MSEAYDPAVRIRRRRRRRSRRSESVQDLPTDPLRRSLLWLSVGLLSLSALLLLGLFNPTAAGIGTIRPSFSVADGQLTLSNADACTWSGVSVQAIGWSGSFRNSVPLMDEGAGHATPVRGNGPFLVSVHCERAGVTQSGFWFGIAY